MAVKVYDTIRTIKTYIDGQRGPTGASAYDIWIEQGNTGSQQDFLNSLVGSSSSGSFASGSVPSGTISGSSQVDYLQISNKPTGIASGSDQFSSSYDIRYERRGYGIVSSSQQINSGSFSGSFTGDGSYISGIVSSSYALTSSYSAFAISASYAPGSNIPSNLLSSSVQISSDISGSFISASNSLSNRINVLESVTPSFAVKTEISGAFVEVSASLSNRISSYDVKTLFSSSAQLPSGLISSSNGFFSSSQQVDYNSIQNKPTIIATASFAVGYVLSSQTASMSVLSASYAPSSPSVSSSYSETASFSTNIQTIGVKIKTEDNYIIEGSKGFRHIGYNSNIIKIRSIANIAGTININIKREGLLLGNYQLLNQSSSLDTTLTGWITSLNANDLIEFYVSQSSTYITDITFFMDLHNR